MLEFIIVTRQHAHETREKVRAGEGEWGRVAAGLRELGERYVTAGPWSVTFSRRHAPSGDPHDYLSQGPYWWPDPLHPDGPYIRRDGEVNPERFDEHHRAMGEMAEAVLALANAGYYLDEPRFSQRAAYLLDVWCNDPATRMNPHLRYGQCIPGVCDGRYIGLIDLHTMDKVVHALAFLGEEPRCAATVAGVRRWLNELLDWLLVPGGFGEQECNHGNNHSSWCAAHILLYAACNDRADVVRRFAEFYRTNLLEQIEADGSLPEELARTRSLHYTRFALEAMATVCTVAERYGVDLWRCENSKGGSLAKAAEFLRPSMEDPHAWQWPQMVDDVFDDTYFMQYLTDRLGLPELARLNARRRQGLPLVRMQEPFGPLCLLEGYHWAKP